MASSKPCSETALSSVTRATLICVSASLTLSLSLLIQGVNPTDASDACLASDARLGQREVQKPVPVGVYLLGHSLLIGAIAARNLSRLLIASPLGQALQEAVGSYLHVLGDIAVSCVLARL